LILPVRKLKGIYIYSLRTIKERAGVVVCVNSIHPIGKRRRRVTFSLISSGAHGS
jgi:hypothetical protein